MNVEIKIYGPVPSRRLGKSMGVNNIPYKVCTYSCVYCQVGKANKMQVARQAFYSPDNLLHEVQNAVQAIQNTEEYPDFIAIVPDGEPTLDSDLGILIKKLKTTGIPVAVITNASLLNLPDVQEDLSKADYVSVKIDAISSQIWSKIDHPVKSIELPAILEGIEHFSKNYSGTLVTETMLVKNYNDLETELNKIASFTRSIKPSTAYLSIPTRPPAYKDIQQPEIETLTQAFHIFKKYLDSVKLLIDYEGNAFTSIGKTENDILAITAVHPMQEKALKELIQKKGLEFDLVNELVEKGLLNKIDYLGEIYYSRNFRHSPKEKKAKN